MLNANNVPRFGSDPEAFFKRDGTIIGSEKLIPERGIRTYAGKVVRDGVQFELNPASATTVSNLGLNIGALLATVQARVIASPGVSISFDGLVEVTREELDSLSPKCRVLGCMPSFNVYEERPISVDPIEYRKRSSGGHIHIGTNNAAFMDQRRRAVPAFDILVGNTCVMFDRDPGAAERRENYGRAGECRFPDHGLEYRTTSNFWLRDYTLMSLTFGLAQIAYDLTVQVFEGNEGLWKELGKYVNIKRIIQAIDQNDFELATKNFKRLFPFLRRHLPKEGFVLTPKNLDDVIGFAQDAQTRNIEAYFPTERIVENWTKGRQIPFNEFIARG